MTSNLRDVRATTPLHIDVADPLSAKVAVIQRFLAEHYFHESGLMYAMWHYKNGEARPLVADDFRGMAMFKIKAGTTMEDLHNQENSPYTSGTFLWSQCLRYRVTREDEALHYAAKAFRSIEANFELCASNGERGLLCKPYGIKFSHETSPDQYVPVIIGMWEYRQIADEATKKKIDTMLPAMSDWWRKRDYKLVYFDREGDWLYHEDARAQYGPLYAAMHLMAHRITGRDEYKREADRVLALVGPFPTRFDFARERLLKTGKTNWPEKLHGYEYDAARRPFIQLDWENHGAIWLPAASASWLIENEPSMQHTLRHALANYFRNIRTSLSDDLMTLYWSQTDLETGKTYPLVRPRISTDRKDYIVDFDWNFCAYASKIGWGNATSRVIDTAILAHHHAPGFSPGALSLARAMLAKLDDSRLQWFVDPDGKQLMPEDSWLGHILSSEAPAFTLLTYWRARAWGIDLDGSSGENV